MPGTLFFDDDVTAPAPIHGSTESVGIKRSVENFMKANGLFPSETTHKQSIKKCAPPKSDKPTIFSPK